jgi:hypothetical protein
MAVALLWAGGTIGAFGHALLDDIDEWREHKDARARRSVMDGSALFIAALASGLSIVAVLMTTPDTDYSNLRKLLTGIAWGFFGAAGIIRATTRSKKP